MLYLEIDITVREVPRELKRPLNKDEALISFFINCLREEREGEHVDVFICSVLLFLLSLIND